MPQRYGALVGRELVEAAMPVMALESEISGADESVSLRRSGFRTICYRERYHVAQFLLARLSRKTAIAGTLSSVRPGRLELPRAIRPTRPSTLRVYQFRHERVGRQYSPAGVFGPSGAAL